MSSRSRFVLVSLPPMFYSRHLNEPNAAVSDINTTRAAFASLAADKACGTQARLIYYMDPGEVLSRPFTARDTYSRKGELLVRLTDAKLAGREFSRRSMGTNTLLGFYGLSFTYGSELILPAHRNVHLRAILWAAMAKSESNGNVEHAEDNIGTHIFKEYLDSLWRNHSDKASIGIHPITFISSMNGEFVLKTSLD